MRNQGFELTNARLCARLPHFIWAEEFQVSADDCIRRLPGHLVRQISRAKFPVDRWYSGAITDSSEFS